MFRSKLIDNTLYVGLSGELDESCALFIRNKLDNVLDNNTINKVVIEMSELNFMDSTGIGVLIGRYKKLKTSKIPIYICNPNLHIEKIFKMTGLYEIMPKIS